MKTKKKTIVSINGTRFSIPPGYMKIQSMPDDPPNSVACCRESQASISFVLMFPIAPSEAMPFDAPDEIIHGIHDTLNDLQGLIAVDCGITANDRKYAFSIVKIVKDGGQGVQYNLTMHLTMHEQIVHIQAFFDETGLTGQRDTVVYEMARQKGWIKNGLDGWAQDPYDPNFTKGKPMNLSEKEDFDQFFPEHPLTLARMFVKFVIQNN